ncbi:MAG TPA: hypothetical protein VGP36_11070 [Mycobacteriales bacterium]|nr:hypothetical protein [Mycobacteriales bacterium]
MRRLPIGSSIGSVAGLVFVLANAGGLPAAAVIRVAGLVALVLVLVLLLRRPVAAPPRPGRAALRTYGLCVVGEVVAIPVGALVVRSLGGPSELVVVWVVFVVGVHFLPFARAFGLPVFGLLAWTLIGLAVVGGALTLAADAAAGRWTAVAAGFVLLGFAAAGPRPAGPGAGVA